MKKFQLKIEYILLIISLLNFCSTVSLKNMSQNNFINMENVLENINSIESGELEDTFYQFTYFSREFKNQLEEIIRLKDYADENQKENLTEAADNFSTSIRKREQQLIFSYDAILYCSLILCFISGAVIFYKIVHQKNELLKIKIINEQQLQFSRNLHDGIAQDLAAVKIYLNKNETEKSFFYAEQALKDVRYLIDSMHVELSKDFVQLVKNNLENFETNFGIKTDLLIASSSLEKIDSRIHIELLRILQETLSNIARHSGASLVNVKITEVGRDLNLIIKDNGKGIDPENLYSHSDEKKHYGIKNIKARVDHIGGKVEFKNDGGCTIAICIKNIIR